MGLNFMSWTPWKYNTSEEKAYSVLASFASGALYFTNEDDGRELKVFYRAVSIGAGKGPSVNATWSAASDPSGSDGNVAVVQHKYFGPLSFPCRGYILGGGASASIAPKIIGAADQTSVGTTIVLFGIWPVFAGVRLWGTGNSLVPGIGASAGIATFQLNEW